MMRGQSELAIQSWEKAVALSERKERFLLAALGYRYGSVGRTEDALRIAKELEGWEDQGIETAAHRALIFSGLGELDRAFDLLEEAYRNREFLILVLTLNPGVERLRQDPRFEDLLRRMGLAQ